MLSGVRSHLSYANVTATGALFVALGGSAYAITGVPDRSGVYHGCVDRKTGVLRVVKAASSCRKPKTVKHGKHRVRIPGESAVTWNQQGPRGVTGSAGQNGQNGRNGATDVVARTKTRINVTSATDEADCNPGERALGGGVGRTDGTTNGGDHVSAGFPLASAGGPPVTPGGTPTAWEAQLTVTGTANVTFYVICAAP